MSQDQDLTRPGWDHYFIGIAQAVARRGSCRRLRVGAVVVDTNWQIVGTGYNGAPRGLPDCLTVGCDVRQIDGRESCVRTLHAESNAIDFLVSRQNLMAIYSTVVPCRPCALRIIQVGIKRVVYADFYESQGTNEAMKLLKDNGIGLYQASKEPLIAKAAHTVGYSEFVCVRCGRIGDTPCRCLVQ